MSEFKWPAEGGGSGDVVGPNSSTDNAVVRFDGVTGELIQNSGVIINDSNDVSGVGDLSLSGDITGGVSAAFTGDVTVFDGTAKEFDVGDEIFEMSSTGLFSFGGFVNNGTTFDVLSGVGHIVDHQLETYTAVNWATQTSISPATANGVTYVFIDNTGTVLTSTTAPTAITRRLRILLGRVVTVASAITTIQSMALQTFDVIGSLSDLAYAIRIFNVSGNVFSANGANLNMNKSAGSLFSYGANFLNDPEDPHQTALASASPATFAYLTQLSGSTGSNTTTVVPGSYDNAGVITTIPGSNAQATIQRIYVFPGGNIRVQYGQVIHSTLAAALQAVSSESYIINPSIPGNGVLAGLLVVTKGCTDLSNTTTARFLAASRFGESSVGAAGQSVSSLQNAYDNSSTPEILTDATRGAVSIKRGSAADTDIVLEVQNGAGSNTFTVNGNGDVVIQGDLTVNGTTTTLNTQTLDVEDKNIRVNHGGTDASAAGAGLTVEGTGATTLATLQYDSALTSKFKLGASGSEDEVLTRTAAQTVTGKTISGANNTLTVRLANDVTGTLPVANGGTGQTTSNTALNALLPTQTGNANKVLSTDGSNTSWVAVATTVTTTEGDIIYRNSSADTRLAGNTTTTKKFLRQVGSGSASAAPSWEEIDQVKGITSGSVIATGYVGQVITYTDATGALTSGQYKDACNVILTAGVWMITGGVTFECASTTVVTRLTWGIGTATGNSSTGLVKNETSLNEFYPASYVPRDEIGRATPTVYVNISSGTTYYLKAFAQFTTAGINVSGFLRATRIA